MFQPAQAHRRCRMRPRAECRTRVEFNDDLIRRRGVFLPCGANNNPLPDLLRVNVCIPRLCPILIGNETVRDRPRTERSTCMSECCDALGERKEAALQARILRQICPHRHRLRILCARQIGIVPKPRVNVLVHERRIVDLGAGSAEFH